MAPIQEATRGLSPRVRGNPIPGWRSCAGRRSIPACAGEPKSMRRLRRRFGVYPRVCGGTCPRCCGRICGWGLSPRVRGNLRRAGPLRHLPRSIPACAGEPVTSASISAIWSVYPRVCGGTEARLFSASPVEGLSPRVRGNLWNHWPAQFLEGSIPACAGEPLPEISTKPLRKVYPRVCGGTVPWVVCIRMPLGLSPRVRGNRCRAWCRAALGRSIPACAGEPQGTGRAQC